MGYDLQVLKQAAIEVTQHPDGSKSARGKAAMLLR